MKWYHGYQSAYDRQCRCTPLSYSSSNDFYFDDDYLDRYPYVDIPKDGHMGTSITRMGYNQITAASQQLTLKNDAIGAGKLSIASPEYYALINNRLVIATMENIGGSFPVSIGDYVDIIFEKNDGTTSIHKGIIGERKNRNDSNANDWGHNGGASVVEIVYYQSGKNVPQPNPPLEYNRFPSNNDPWGAGAVTRIVKTGNFYNSCSSCGR